MPASATAVGRRRRLQRFPLPAGQLRPARGGLCVLLAGGSGPGLLENELVLRIADGFLVTNGHILVMPGQHGADGLVLRQPEWN